MISTRMCVACRTNYPKNELLRFIVENGELVIDKSGKIDGRGCYLCKDKECIKKAIKANSVFRSLKITSEREALEKLLSDYVD